MRGGGSLVSCLCCCKPLLSRRRCSASTSPTASSPRRRLILRHVDSLDAGSLGGRGDHDRSISKVGRTDAAAASRKLQEMGWIPELILSSDATRTRQTLEIMRGQAEASFSAAKIYYLLNFYSVAAMDGQTAEHLREAVCRYSRDGILIVMCMGHNKGWEEAASMLSGAPIHLSTCNAALLESKGASWEQAFSLAGLGGWKLCSIVKPNSAPETDRV